MLCHEVHQAQNATDKAVAAKIALQKRPAKNAANGTPALQNIDILLYLGG